MYPIAHFWQPGLTLASVYRPLRFALDSFNKRVAQPLRELVKRNEVVAFFSLGAGLSESPLERGTRPDVAERVGRIRVERSTSRPNGQEEFEEGLPQQGERKLG